MTIFYEAAIIGGAVTFGGGGGPLLSGFNSKVKKLTLLSGSRYFRGARYYRNSTVIIFHIYIAHFLYNTQMCFTTMFGELYQTANAVYS